MSQFFIVLETVKQLSICKRSKVIVFHYIEIFVFSFYVFHITVKHIWPCICCPKELLCLLFYPLCINLSTNDSETNPQHDSATTMLEMCSPWFLKKNKKLFILAKYLSLCLVFQLAFMRTAANISQACRSTLEKGDFIWFKVSSS